MEKANVSQKFKSTSGHGRRGKRDSEAGEIRLKRKGLHDSRT